MKERVIVLDTRKYPATLAEATLAYARETISNVNYFLAKNEHLTKKLQAAR